MRALRRSGATFLCSCQPPRQIPTRARGTNDNRPSCTARRRPIFIPLCGLLKAIVILRSAATKESKTSVHTMAVQEEAAPQMEALDSSAPLRYGRNGQSGKLSPRTETEQLLRTEYRSREERVIRHLSSIAEVVDDIDAAVDFYRRVLGLPVDHEPGGGYATVTMPGALHFSIWSRRAAAEATFGDEAAADRIPIGFSVEFEVDSVDSAAETAGESRSADSSGSEGGAVGPDDKPLHAPQRDAWWILGNAVGTPHQPGPASLSRISQPWVVRQVTL